MKVSTGVVCALAMLTLGACSSPTTPPEPTAQSPSERISPLEMEILAASDEFGVPADLMKAVAWVETRWATPPLPGDDHGGHEHAHSYRTYGIMGLKDGAPWQTLQRASALTGLDEGHLTFDRPDNIRGAAAVLRALLEEDTGAEIPSGAVVEVWAEAVGRYGGGDDTALQARFRQDVFDLLSTGMRAHTEEGLPMRIAASGRASIPTLVTRQQAIEPEYPGARFDQAHTSNFSNQSRSRAAITHITIHVTQGAYNGAISWFKNPSSNVSAHYVIRSSDGDITQMVKHEDKAWHVGNSNPYTIGIEHEGFVSEPRWFTDEMYRSSAALTRHIAQTWGVPIDREHIKGHIEFPNQTHSDPGPHWDWNRFMALVREEDAGPAKGNMVGYVREDDIYNTEAPLGGVTVTLGTGQTTTTDNNGFYRFNDLELGGYTITASLDGYDSATIERPVDVQSGDAWGSLALSRTEDPEPVVETGALGGVVNDGSAPLAGVLVTVGDTTVNSDGNGEFRLEELSPGTYDVTLSKPGHVSLNVSRDIVANQETWLGVSLPLEGDDQEPMVTPDPNPGPNPGPTPDPTTPDPNPQDPVIEEPDLSVGQSTHPDCAVAPSKRPESPAWLALILVGVVALRFRR